MLGDNTNEHDEAVDSTVLSSELTATSLLLSTDQQSFINVNLNHAFIPLHSIKVIT